MMMGLLTGLSAVSGDRMGMPGQYTLWACIGLLAAGCGAELEGCEVKHKLGMAGIATFVDEAAARAALAWTREGRERRLFFAGKHVCIFARADDDDSRSVTSSSTAPTECPTVSTVHTATAEKRDAQAEGRVERRRRQLVCATFPEGFEAALIEAAMRAHFEGCGAELENCKASYNRTAGVASITTPAIEAVYFGANAAPHLGD